MSGGEDELYMLAAPPRADSGGVRHKRLQQSPVRTCGLPAPMGYVAEDLCVGRILMRYVMVSFRFTPSSELRALKPEDSGCQHKPVLAPSGVEEPW